MNNYLHHQYIETRAKFNKFSVRLQKSQERGEFQKFSKRKQHFLLSRVRKLWEKLRLLEVQLKIASVGISMALLLMVNNASAQQFVEAPEKNPMATPTIFGDRIELFDIDGDGDLDILTSFDSRRIIYYKNKGTAFVPDFKKVPDSESPFDELNEDDYFDYHRICDAADIDNDGDIDLLLQEGYILRNTGSNEIITYEPEHNGGIDKYRYRLGDIDADGDLDVISFDRVEGVKINENTGNASTFTINGSEMTLPVSDWNTSIDGISDVEVADLDQDGDLDLLVTSRLYIDDEDQKKTLLIANTGTAEVPAFTLESDENNPYCINEEYRIHIGDLDADGDFDLIMESYPDMFTYYNLNVNVLEENRDLIPEFYDGIILPYSYAPPQFVDFDGDGDLDFFAGRDDDYIYFEQVKSSSQSKFLKREEVKLPFMEDVSSNHFLSFGDIDGDGDVDVWVFSSEYDQNTWDYNDVHRLFENTGTADNPVFEEKLDAGFDDMEDFFISSFVDIDADGDLDLFMGGWERFDWYSRLSTKYFENTGDDHLEFTEKSGYNDNPLIGVTEINFPGLEYAYLAFTDLDNDGDYDVVFTGYYGKIHFLENIGTATKAQFVDHTNESPFWGIFTGYYGTVSMADVDGDGDDDLFTHHYYGKLTTYYENTSNSKTGLPKNHKNRSLELFPNPVVNELTVEFPGNVEGPLDYQILSIEGRSVQNGELQNQSSFDQYIINTESLHSGYYLLKINTEKQSYISKFVKQ